MIQLNNVSKQFAEQKVINDVSLTITEGQIFGLLGRNGAGKTTLMKMILGLIKIDSGSIAVFEENVVFGQTPTNRHIGYLPDVPAFYPYMTSMEYLQYCGEIAGLDKKLCKERANYYLELVGLENNNKRIKGFSRGMKQRLGIAQALIHQPKILICDEPTSALDPIGRQEVLSVLQKIKKETTVIFSTHILNDAEKICDNIAILHDGKFVLNGSIQEILQDHQQNQLQITLQNEADYSAFELAFPHAEIKQQQFIIQTSNLLLLQREIHEFCLKNAVIIQSMSIKQASLDDLFLEVTSL